MHMSRLFSSLALYFTLLTYSLTSLTPYFLSYVLPSYLPTFLQVLRSMPAGKERFAEMIEANRGLQAHFDSTRGHVPLGLLDRILAKMKNTGGKHCISTALKHTFGQML